MLAGVDLSTPEAVEQLRRSVAMLPPQAPALDREEAMDVLTTLGEALRTTEAQPRPGRPRQARS
jgi:hypothetical protein